VNTATVDSFSARLSKALGALDWKAKSDLLLKIGKTEMMMKMQGIERPPWMGPVSQDKILGAEAVIQTEQGERRGNVIYFGVLESAKGWERSVVVHVPASGTHHEVPGSLVRLASPEDSARIKM
jgi:hypothetical protein